MTGEHSDLQRGLLAPPSSLRFGSKRLAGIAVLAASSIAAILVSRTWAIVEVASIAARDQKVRTCARELGPKRLRTRIRYRLKPV